MPCSRSLPTGRCLAGKMRRCPSKSALIPHMLKSSICAQETKLISACRGAYPPPDPPAYWLHRNRPDRAAFHPTRAPAGNSLPSAEKPVADQGQHYSSFTRQALVSGVNTVVRSPAAPDPAHGECCFHLQAERDSVKMRQGSASSLPFLPIPSSCQYIMGHFLRQSKRIAPPSVFTTDRFFLCRRRFSNGRACRFPSSPEVQRFPVSGH